MSDKERIEVDWQPACRCAAAVSMILHLCRHGLYPRKWRARLVIDVMFIGMAAVVAVAVARSAPPGLSAAAIVLASVVVAHTVFAVIRDWRRDEAMVVALDDLVNGRFCSLARDKGELP